MLCPFCLSQQTFKAQPRKGSTELQYLCNACHQLVPPAYVKDYQHFPPVVVSAIGFRAHGKTVYLASLFEMLFSPSLARRWTDLWHHALNEESQGVVEKNRLCLKEGRLPDATPQNFPIPTIVRISGIPGRRNATLLLYDTSGEAFEKERPLIDYARFVTQAKTVMFLIDVHELGDPGRQMHRLLETYLNGMAALKANTRRQNMLLVLTKADVLCGRLDGKWQDLGDYVRQGELCSWENWQIYTHRMRRLSRRLETFVNNELGGALFHNLARNSFARVSYSVVSALGAEPDRETKRLAVGAVPKRVVDPLLWVLEPESWWRRLFRSR